MKAIKNDRGFVVVMHAGYPSGAMSRLIQESSAVGDYQDSLAKPGSSFLWIGNEHHLNREEVKDLAGRLNHWLKNKTLKLG